MRVEKKQITKEDERKLVYYHFPETATTEEERVFQEIDAPLEALPQPSPHTTEEGKKSV